MAVDEVLLHDAAQSDIATLRFYQWAVPTLSLGYFQRFNDCRQHAASRDCSIVRRSTGGGAILHDRELTYSLAVPASHPLAHQAETLYAAVHDAFIATLQPAVAQSPLPWVLKRNEKPAPATGEEPFMCFERRAAGDVLLVSPTDPSGTGWKILGSAQRRHRGAVLQHGSLLLEHSPSWPGLLGFCDLTRQHLRAIDLVAAAIAHLPAALGLHFVETSLPPGLKSASYLLADNKYGSREWTARR